LVAVVEKIEMRPSAGIGTTSKLAVVRPWEKLRVESTGRSPSG
jgi:hypothetical protein